MLKLFIVICLSTAFNINVKCDFPLKGNFQHKTETTTTTTQLPPKTSKSSSLYIYNNVPKPGLGCTVNFVCKKKLKEVPPPKPCVKYCVKTINCPNNVKIHGTPDQCFELNEQMVMEEATAYETQSTTTGMPPLRFEQVALIDFPCQPGYLPDSRGRCREVW